MKYVAAHIQPSLWGGKALFEAPEGAPFDTPGGIRFDRLRSNGPVGMFHDLDSLPVGRITDVAVSADGRTAEVHFEFGERSDPRTAQCAASVAPGPQGAPEPLLRLCELMVDDDGQAVEFSIVSLASDVSDRGDRADGRSRFCAADGSPDPFETRMDAQVAFQVADEPPPPAHKSARELEHSQFFSVREDSKHNNREESPMGLLEDIRSRNRETAERQRTEHETGLPAAAQRHTETATRQDASSAQRWKSTLPNTDKDTGLQPEHRAPGWRGPTRSQAPAARLDGCGKPTTTLVNGMLLSDDSQARLDASSEPRVVRLDEHEVARGGPLARESRRRPQKWQQHFENERGLLRQIRDRLPPESDDAA